MSLFDVIRHSPVIWTEEYLESLPPVVWQRYMTWISEVAHELSTEDWTRKILELLRDYEPV